MVNDQQTSKQRTRGFTLIEIVLVLAIAGLILVAVFIAVSGAQSNRRDFQRKQYMGTVAAAVESYFSNNQEYPNPSDPATITEFEGKYLTKGTDPLTGVDYLSTNSTFVYRGSGGAHNDNPPVGTIYIQYAHYCTRPGRPHQDGPDDVISGNDTGGFFVVWMGMENGTFYCLDNYPE